MSKLKDDLIPGAGTLYVHRLSSRGTGPHDGHDRAIPWDEIVKIREEAVISPSPDVLLERGIGEYTFLPSTSSILGRGKFSAVYKVVGPDGQFYALKHTPLHPHHPLIAARLLREPTLLAQLNPHPCLIGVEGIIRTEGHFYLIEQYASHHVPLPSHPLPLLPSRAAYILDQLVSVIRDCLHSGRVCHRDLKGENILVDTETGDILILDLGLATQFSASEAKLTTCCGSPAFHSPEIVEALAHPPGVITYYGPELDIWCIALTLLSLLLRTRFPLGPHHTHRQVMRQRVLDRLQELDEIYLPRAPYRAAAAYGRSLTTSEKIYETSEWVRVRTATKDFLEIDGIRRMRAFEAYEIGSQARRKVDEFNQGERPTKGFKSTSFVPTEIKYTLPLYLESHTESACSESRGENKGKTITLLNPTGMAEGKVLSYIRYLLRSSGIGYHCIPQSDQTANPILQLVLAIPPPPVVVDPLPPRSPGPNATSTPTQGGWVSNLLPFKRPVAHRSVSVPAKAAGRTSPPMGTSNKKQKDKWLKCWMKVEFEDAHSSSQSTTTLHNQSSSSSEHERATRSRASSISTRTGTSSSHHYSTEGVVPLIQAKDLADSLSKLVIVEGEQQTLAVPGTNARRPSPRRKTTSDKTPHVRLPPPPSPLSRQVSLEPVKRKPSTHTQNRGTSHADSRARSRTASGRVRRGRQRVIVHLSDDLGYDVLRKALDIRHLGSKGNDSTGRNSESATGQTISVTSISEIETPRVKPADLSERRVSTPPVLIPRETDLPIQEQALDRQGNQLEADRLSTHSSHLKKDVEEEVERGRPRSKDDSKLYLRNTPPASISSLHNRDSNISINAHHPSSNSTTPRPSKRELLPPQRQDVTSAIVEVGPAPTLVDPNGEGTILDVNVEVDLDLDLDMDTNKKQRDELLQQVEIVFELPSTTTGKSGSTSPGSKSKASSRSRSREGSRPSSRKKGLLDSLFGRNSEDGDVSSHIEPPVDGATSQKRGSSAGSKGSAKVKTKTVAYRDREAGYAHLQGSNRSSSMPPRTLWAPEAHVYSNWRHM